MDFVHCQKAIVQILASNNSLNEQVIQINQLVHTYSREWAMDKSKVQWLVQSIVDSQKIKLDAVKQLVCYRADIPGTVYPSPRYLNRAAQITVLKNLPQPVQKSVEWYEQRSTCLTATSIATVIDEDPYSYPIDILLDKCGQSTPFVENDDVHHGKKYEQIGTMFYSFRNHTRVVEYGLLRSNRTPFIAASPDGICETSADNGLTKLVGRLLEIKFPRRRKIISTGTLDGEICPHYYYVQVQTQLYVTEMDECDFLQCKVEEYATYEDYLTDSAPNLPGLSGGSLLEKGCLIELYPKKNLGAADCLYGAKYIYPPKLHMSPSEIEEWLAHIFITHKSCPDGEHYILHRVIYWKLTKVDCHLIAADTDWFNSKIPLLTQFWNYVLFYREHPGDLTNLIQFVHTVGKDQSRDIFEKIHKDYSAIHPNNQVSLYQKQTSWRKKYNQKRKWQKQN